MRTFLLATLCLAAVTAPAWAQEEETGSDFELELQLSAPRGWVFEKACAAGERLRLVRRDGRGVCSLLVRPLEIGTGSLAESVRASLGAELAPDAMVEAADGRVEIEQTRRAALAPRVIRTRSTAFVHGAVLVLVRACTVDEGADAAQLRAEADLARRSLQPMKDRARLSVDRERRFAIFSHEGDDAEKRSLATQNGGSLQVKFVGSPPRAAVAQALSVDVREVALVDSGGGVVRARTEKVRAAAWETDAGTVVAVARAQDQVELKRVANALLVRDPEHLQRAALRGREGAQLVVRARDARDRLSSDESVALLASALALFPEDPDALELKAALRRDEGDRGVAELEAAWGAFAAPWTSELLARARLDEALAASAEHKPAPASFRFAHALELSVNEDAVSRAAAFYQGGDAIGNPLAVLPGLQRVRELVPDSLALKKAESDLRLRAARVLVEERSFVRAHDEAHRAKLLGADVNACDEIDKRIKIAEHAKKVAKPKKPEPPVEDEERPRRRDRREPAPIAGFRPLDGAPVVR